MTGKVERISEARPSVAPHEASNVLNFGYAVLRPILHPAPSLASEDLMHTLRHPLAGGQALGLVLSVTPRTTRRMRTTSYLAKFVARLVCEHTQPLGTHSNNMSLGLVSTTPRWLLTARAPHHSRTVVTLSLSFVCPLFPCSQTVYLIFCMIENR